MEIRQLKTFQTVATLMSFHGAAKELGYAQSTVSAQIQNLEQSLGVKLFKRVGKRISLTEAGTKLLRYAAKMLALEGEARAELAKEGRALGTLNIQMPESLCMVYLPELLARFQEQFPEVRLTFSTCTAHGLQEDLQKGVADIAFLLVDSFSAEGLEVEHLGVERVVLVAGQGHVLAGKLTVPTAILGNETLLLVSSDCYAGNGLEALLEKINPASVVELSSLGALLGCVSAGSGVALLPLALAQREQKAGRLSILEWEEKGQKVTRMMLHHKEKSLSPPLQGFMVIARKLLAL